MDAVMNKVRLGFLFLGLGALIFLMLVRLPSSTAAQVEQGFGDQILKGTYGFKLEGVSYETLPPSGSEEAERLGPASFNILGQIVADGEGQITQGVRTVNFDGDVFQDTVTGTYAVNADGTGSLTLSAFMGEDQVAVEEFACFFTQTGNQFECTVTSVTLMGEEPLPEVSWVALATGLQQSTGIPVPVAASQPGELLWKFEFGGNFPGFSIEPRSAEIVDETIYFGGFDGNFYALDKNAGQEQWHFETGEGSITTSPTVSDGVAYFGNKDHNLFAVDLETGQEKWRFETGSEVGSSPAVADGVVYFGSDDGHLYAVDVETGQEKWHFETGGQVGSSPAIFDGVVYFGSADDSFYAVDVETGQEKWRFKTGLSMGAMNGVMSSPAIVDGVAYFGSDDRYVYAVDLETGEQKWRFQTLAFNGSPIVEDGVVYIGSTDNYLYAIDLETGQEEWKFWTNGEVNTSPAAVEGVVYFGSDDGHLYAVDVETGQEEWSFETEGAVSGSPIIEDGVVYFLSRDGNFYAVRAG